jgi:phosphate transport system substrate-binding protein
MRSLSWWSVLSAATLAAILCLLCTHQLVAQNSVTLVATGSSLPEPLYLVWGDEYHKGHSDIQLRYLAEGTGESINRVLAGTGDFGGGDAPIPEKQLKETTRQIIELPSILIGIAVVYDLPGVTGGVRLSGPVLVDIFMGKITVWNNAAIAKLNPDIQLPNLPIKVLHRSEGKGSSYIFSDYLSSVSPEFLARVGKSVSPKWPVGASFNRTPDLLENARKTPGAIAYTELNWAEKSGLGIARIRNAGGEFVRPTANSISQAASALGSKMTGDFRVSLVNAPGKESYPISSFTWLYIPSQAADADRRRAVKDYLKWVYTVGQKIAREQGYAPLPDDVLSKVTSKVASIR